MPRKPNNKVKAKKVTRPNTITYEKKKDKKR